jgi:hypothetical protein
VRIDSHLEVRKRSGNQVVEALVDVGAQLLVALGIGSESTIELNVIHLPAKPHSVIAMSVGEVLVDLGRVLRAANGSPPVPVKASKKPGMVDGLPVQRGSVIEAQAKEQFRHGGEQTNSCRRRR